MTTQIIRIGNSRGIRIPKPLLDESGLQGEVHLESKRGMIIVTSASKPRAGWAEALASCPPTDDDYPWKDAPVSLSSWDESEWTW